MIQTSIKHLLEIDMHVTISSEKEGILKNGTKVFRTTIKRTRPIIPGKK